MKINAFSKHYRDKLALSLPELELTSGKICAVIGSNGSGKSSMARLLAGVLQTDDRSLPVSKNINVGYMPQKSFAFRMSTAANILLAGGDKAGAAQIMKRLGIAHLASRRAKALSGGETARMALARLLMQPHDLLILDEPTASMDMESTALAEALIRDYCEETECTVLLITHSLQQARRMADYALYLHKGELLEYGPAEKLFTSPDRAETREFLNFYGPNGLI